MIKIQNGLATAYPNTPLPIRCGDRVHTLPCSGDDLIGRVNAVLTDPQGRTFYRVKFPIVSPYFREGAGVIYRAHEIEHHHEKPAIRVTLPARPKPTKSTTL